MKAANPVISAITNLQLFYAVQTNLYIVNGTQIHLS